MKKYKTLLFDLDDTLIDNAESIKYAFFCVTKYLNIPYDDNIGEIWYKFDTLYWNSWENGNLSIPENIKTIEEKVIFLRTNRFIKFFEQYNIVISKDEAININNIYCNNLSENVKEIDNAHEVINYLSKNYELVIATNGAKVATNKKLEKINIDKYISYIVASEEAGYGKPMPEFFDFMLKKINNENKHEMLLIGDSLNTDILGGMKNNIDTCWFNKNNIDLPPTYKPTITINKLLELKKIL
ncbi:MAG: HAD family hydrolase [Bacilli bacterium]